MKILRRIAPIALAVLIFCLSCSGSQSPVGPDYTPSPGDLTPVLQYAGSDANRSIWGLWQVDVAEDHQSAELIPLRVAGMHLNATKIIESQPPGDFLSLDVTPQPDSLLEVKVELTHPFPGNYNLTGFDVRGIFMSGTDYIFPGNLVGITWGNHYPRMADPDGYTYLFNPVCFPESSDVLPLFSYFTGKYAVGNNVSSIVNPYVSYAESMPRHVFKPGYGDLEIFRLYPADGAFSFGYAISACWAPPGMEVTDPITQFPPEANCEEAYDVDVTIWPELAPVTGSKAHVFVQIRDWQGLDTIKYVTCECPQLFSSILQLDHLMTEGITEIYTFYGEISNDYGAQVGIYPILVIVEDTESDPNLGPSNAWMVSPVRVTEGWLRTWGEKYDHIYSNFWLEAVSVATDNEGNAFVLSNCHGCFDFDTGLGFDEISCFGPSVTKLNEKGQYEWAAEFTDHNPGQLMETFAEEIAVDSLGNIYFIGSFNQQIDVDPSEVIQDFNAVRAWDAFLIKLNPDGDLCWAKHWFGSDAGVDDTECYGQFLTINQDDVITVGGNFSGLVDFEPGQGITEYYGGPPSGVPHSSYISIFDSEGNFQSVEVWTSEDGINILDMAIDDSGNIYTVGTFKGSVDLDPDDGTFIYESEDSESGFMCKLSPTGEYLDSRAWIGDTETYNFLIASGHGENIYVIGSHDGALDMDPGPGENIIDVKGFYCSSLNTNMEFQNAITWPDAFIKDITDITISNDGNLYTVGRFEKQFDFDPGPGIYDLYAVGHRDVFMSTYDENLNFINSVSWGGRSNDNISGITTDNPGHVFVTGTFSSTTDFEPGPLLDERTPIGSMAYLLKLMPDGTW